MADIAGIVFKTDGQDNTDPITKEIYDPQDSSWYEKVKRIRLDPTIALARAIAAAPIVGNSWRIEGEDERAKEILTKALLPHREMIMKDAVPAAIDYGWNAWEVVPVYVQGQDVVHIDFKPLRHDRTTILVDRNGFPIGLKNTPSVTSLTSGEVTLLGTEFTITNAQTEYGNPYGRPLLKNIEEVYDKYIAVERAANKYINKVAGAFRLIWFPVGTSMYNGRETSNQTIAENILEMLHHSGDAAFPVSQIELNAMLSGSGTAGDARKSAWNIELLEAKGGMDPFLDRQKYLDALKMRGLFSPERAALEGSSGTKEEAGEHADIGLLALEQWGNDIIDSINAPYGFARRVLELNGFQWYPGCAKVVPLPLSDSNKAFMREIFRTIVNNIKDYSMLIDLEELGKRADIPVLAENIKKLKNEGDISRGDEDEKEEVVEDKEE